MSEVISIYEAKTNLSKLVKRAKKGETIYIGAYGSPEAIIAPIKKNSLIKFGVLEHKSVENAYEDKDLIEPDTNAWKGGGNSLLK